MPKPGNESEGQARSPKQKEEVKPKGGPNFYQSSESSSNN